MKVELEKRVQPKTVAEYLNISRQMVMKAIREERLPADKVGGIWLIKIKDVEAWVESGGDLRKQ